MIETLSYNKKTFHVPFRDSVLTTLLQEVFSGNSITSIVLNISPEEKSRTEGYNTLCFGRKAAKVEKVVKKNKNYSYNTLINLVERLRKEIKFKDARIVELEKCLRDHSLNIPGTLLNINNLS